MKRVISGIYLKFLHPDLGFRVRLFNVLAMTGMVAALFAGIPAYFFNNYNIMPVSNITPA